LLGSLDGDGHKVFQPGRTAEFSAADANAAQQAGLVPDANLAHLDPDAKAVSQVLHELAKIDAPLGGEKEGRFAAIEGVFDFR
jgi:hypothetical protein